MKKGFLLKLSLLVSVIGILTLHNVKGQTYSLYGVAQYGGKYNDGVIFRYNYPSGNDTVVLNFNDTNGAVPKGFLMVGSDGNLYGTTSEGGTSNDGVFFCFNPNTYKDTVLVNFNGGNGSDPQGGVFQAGNGLIYGLTLKGGVHGLGFCFQYDIVTKTQTALFSFDGVNGSKPNGSFIQASNGLLIGHTVHGGTYGDGVLFYYNIGTGNDSVLVNFNDSTGYSPKGLFQASNGLIYGTNTYGSDSDYGVIYSYDLSTRVYHIVKNFTIPSGINPTNDESSLFQSFSGLLYGITQLGGTDNKGVLYSYDIYTGMDSILMNFSSPYSFGKNPYASGYIQIQSYDRLLFTSIDSGGAYNMGTLLEYNPVSRNFTKLLDFNDTNGAYPTNNLVAIENKCETIKTCPEIDIFPNPSLGIVSMSGQNYSGESQVQIFNILGDKVYQGRYIQNSFINLENQPKGIYLYRIISVDGSAISSGKFIIE